jgi:hypothetical protein
MVEFIAFFITFTFLLMGVVCFIKGFFYPNPENIPPWLKDLFAGKIELGYLDDDEELGFNDGDVYIGEDELSNLKKQVEMLKLKKQLEELKSECSSPLMKDCIDALVAIGEQKSAAKTKAKNVFDRCPDIKTVDEFIKEAFGS